MTIDEETHEISHVNVPDDLEGLRALAEKERYEAELTAYKRKKKIHNINYLIQHRR